MKLQILAFLTKNMQLHFRNTLDDFNRKIYILNCFKLIFKKELLEKKYLNISTQK